MRKRKAAVVLTGIFLIAGFLVAGFGGARAASPKGVLRASVHWGISADWLDPSMPSLGNASEFVLRLFHDSLVKQMPEGLYTPCLAESWTITPD
jgi:ABC-type transport system substrate-binding protein